MSVILAIMIFGKVSMTAGPFPDIKSCQADLVFRSRELDASFAKVTGGGLVLGGRLVTRRDVTLECKFDDQPIPELRGTMG